MSFYICLIIALLFFVFGYNFCGFKKHLTHTSFDVWLTVSGVLVAITLAVCEIIGR